MHAPDYLRCRQENVMQCVRAAITDDVNRDDHLFRGVLLSGADSSFLPARSHSAKLFFSEPAPPSEPFRLRQTRRPTALQLLCNCCAPHFYRIERGHQDGEQKDFHYAACPPEQCDTVRLIWSKSATLTLISLGKKWPPSKINLARAANNDHLLGRQPINNVIVTTPFYFKE